MISNLHFLGIYEDAINNAIESAENLMKRPEFDFNVADIDEMNDWALEYLKKKRRLQRHNQFNNLFLFFFS